MIARQGACGRERRTGSQLASRLPQQRHWGQHSKAAASRPSRASSLPSHVCPSFDPSPVHPSLDMHTRCLETQLQKSALHNTVEDWK